VDGQHRVGALRVLLGRGEWPHGQRVLMEVLPLPTDDAVTARVSPRRGAFRRILAGFLSFV